MRPSRLARTAAHRPTDEVPPRISNDWPAFASKPTVSEPYAVCSISGTAPITLQGRLELNGITCAAGTQVYSA